MTWRTLNEVMNKKKTNKGLLKESVGNNPTEIINDPSKITNTFNEYFVTRASHKNKDKTFDNYLTNNYKESMFLEPITIDEIETEITNMKQNKSPGYDNISSKIIKLTAKNISESLTHILNTTFLTGIIPDKLKIALVTPIFKTNENTKFKNYRPISVLSCFPKLLEKLT